MAPTSAPVPGHAPPTVAPPPGSPPPPAASVNAFYARGEPAFVRGTAGDDMADHAIATQIELLRGAVFSTAAIHTDQALAGLSPDGWPTQPVVYGGAHVNSLIAALTLPITVRANRLELGATVLTGPALALAAVIPAGPTHPEFLWYAGTGQPGVSGINSQSVIGPGQAAIAIADAFGLLHTGHWDLTGPHPVAVLDAARRRIGWRTEARVVGPVTVNVRFPDMLAATGDAPAAAAVARGVQRAVDALALRGPASLDVYVYPDVRSKQALTGTGGDGHAVTFARAVHVVASPGLDVLLAHEATHVLVIDQWGNAGNPLIGEGLAVWVAGGYAGQSIPALRAGLGSTPVSGRALAGPAFRKLAEPVAYAHGGVLVDAVVRRLGLAQLRPLYLATPATWDAACAELGVSPAEVDQWASAP